MAAAARTALPRATVHVLLWSALLVLLFGSRVSLHVCTGTCCAAPAAAASAATGCCTDEAAACCCAHGGGAPTAAGAAEGDDAPAEPHTRGTCRAGCCVDLQLAFEQGPLPRRVAAEDGPQLVAVAPPAPPAVPFALGADEPEPHPPATGPPRRDRRTELLSTTILRL